MSLIADALKKAQRAGQQPVEGLPPFDLKKGPEKAPAVAAGSAPPMAQPKAAAPVAAQAAPTVTGAPRPKPLAAAVGKSGPSKRWSWRIPALVSVILVLAASVEMYVNRVYLPRVRSGGMTVTGGARPVQVRKATPPATSEVVQTVTPAADSAQAAAGPAQASSADSLKPATPSTEIAVTKPPVIIEQSSPKREAREVSARPRPSARRISLPPSRTPAPEPAAAVAPQPEESHPTPVEAPVATAPENATSESQAAPQGEITSLARDENKDIRQDIYHFNMAVFYQRQGDIQSALAEYQKVIDITPYNAEVYSNMGVLYNQMGEYDKAVSVLQRALLIDPRYSKAHNNLGLAYYRSGQYEQALEHLNRAVELEPASQDAFNNLGLVHKKMGLYETAEKDFQRAFSIDKSYAAAHYNLALLYDEVGRLDRAAEQYRSFLESGGGNQELNEKVKGRLAQLGQP